MTMTMVLRKLDMTDIFTLTASVLPGLLEILKNGETVSSRKFAEQELRRLSLTGLCL